MATDEPRAPHEPPELPGVPDPHEGDTYEELVPGFGKRHPIADRTPLVFGTPNMGPAEFIDDYRRELAAGPASERAARLHYEIGRLFETAMQDAQRAYSHYDTALALQPDHLPSLRGAIRLCLRMRTWDRALELLDTELTLTRDPQQRALLILKKGRILEDHLDRAEEALVAYHEALALNEGDPSVLKAIEQRHRASGALDELGETLERLGRTLTDDPKLRAAVLAERGLLAERAGDPDLAAEQHDHALRLTPEALGSVRALKRLYHAQERWRDLADILKHEAMQTQDHDIEAMALFRLGRLQADRLRDPEAAIETLEEAREVAPSARWLLQALIQLHQAQGEYARAVALLEDLVAIEADPADQLVLCHRIGHLKERQLNDVSGALPWYRKALSIDPTYGPALGPLCARLRARGDWAALVEVRRAEAQTAADPQRRASAWAEVADILEVRLDRVDDAVEHHKNALAALPGYLASFRALERLYRSLERYRELVTLHEGAVANAIDDERAVAHLFDIAQIYEDLLGEPAQAAQAFTRILERKPGDLRAIAGLQRACERAGRHSALVAALELELETKPSTQRHLELLCRVADVLDDKLNNRDGALSRLRQAEELDPKYLPALSRLATIYEREGHYERLLGVHRRQIEAIGSAGGGRERVRLLERMGRLCEEHLGRPGEALGFYWDAVATDARFRPALEALERLLRQRGDREQLARHLEMKLSVTTEPSTRAMIAFELGEIWEQRLQDRAQAMWWYDKALEEDPRCRPAIDALAAAAAETKAWGRLSEALEHEAKVTPDRTIAVEALMRRGQVLRDELDDLSGAAQHFGTVVAQTRGHVGALLALENAYRALGKTESLKRVYAAQAEVFDDEGAKIAALRELARIQGMPGSRRLFERILSLAPDDLDAISELERAALETMDRTLLSRVDVELVRLTDDAVARSAYRTRLGESLEAAGDPRALAAYRGALSTDAENQGAARGLFRLGEMLDEPEVMSEAIEHLARLATRPARAADLLVRRAKLLDARLSRTEQATGDLERALELSPDHALAADRLGDLLIQSGQVTRLTQRLEQAASQAESRERSVALWTEAARLHEHHLADLGSAIRALEQILEDQDDHALTLLKVGTLCRRAGRGEDAVRHLSNLVMKGARADDETLIGAHMELAEVFATQLGDEKRAVTHLQGVLERDPAHREALTRLASLQQELGDLDGAVTTLKGALKVAKSARDRIRLLLELGALERRRGQHGTAAEVLEKAVRLGGAGKATKAYLETIDHGGSYERYAKALAAHVAAAEKRGKARAKNYLELARVLGQELGQADRAIEILRQAVVRGAGTAAVHSALTRQLVDAGQWDELLAEIEPLLHDGPASAQIWRDLATAWAGLGKKVEAVLALEPLVVMGLAEGSEQKQVHQRKKLPGQAGVSSYGPDALRALTSEDTATLPAEMLLAAASDGLVKLSPPTLDTYGVFPKDRIKPRSDHPLRGLTEAVAQVFGLSNFELYVHRLPSMGAVAELGDPPILILPEGLHERPYAEQVFVVGTAVAPAVRGLAAATRLKLDDIERALAAAARTVIPSYGSGRRDEAEIEEYARRLSRALPRRSKKAVAEAAELFAAAGPVDVPSWVARIEYASVRAAALLADDLGACVSALTRMGRVGEVTGVELLDADPRIDDLCRFWASRSALAHRRRAGQLTGR